jgi:hypothetical protein
MVVELICEMVRVHPAFEECLPAKK